MHPARGRGCAQHQIDHDRQARPVPRGQQVDGVGDSRDAVRLGMAAGAAMLTTPGTRPCRREEIENLYHRLADATSVDSVRVETTERQGT
ncbi:hypothetical protein ABI214_01785 [Prescottella soli]|uniref:Carbohydrate kinase PfkB domain-containing protein n=1 Tax=Prescottella soli TaxID=1543852 RepID=A0ABW9FW46_9NOCA